MAPPADRADLVGPAQQLDLGRLGDRLGQDRRPALGAAASTRVRATSRTPPPPPRAAAAAASAAARRPASERSAVWAKPVVSPTTTRMPGAPLAARGQLLDPAVVEPGRRAAPVLGEHLGELAAGAQRDAEHALHHRLVDHGTPFRPPAAGTRAALARGEATRVPLAIVPVKIGVSGEVELTVTRRRHRAGPRLGRRRRPRHAAGRRPVRGGRRGRPRRPAGRRTRPRSAPASSWPTWPRSWSARRCGPTPPSRRSRASGWCSTWRSTTTAAWSRPARSPGWSSTSSAVHGEGPLADGSAPLERRPSDGLAQVGRPRVGDGGVEDHVDQVGHARRPGPGRGRDRRRPAGGPARRRRRGPGPPRRSGTRAGGRRPRRSRTAACIGCFSRPQMPLLPTTITTGRPWRTRVSASMREKPAAPSPSMSTTWRSGWATRAAMA